MVKWIQDYYRAHELRVSIYLFLGGFLFDILTLNRIDDIFGISSQAFYLFLVQTIMILDFLAERGKYTPPKWLERIWPFREGLLHFLFGSLLSAYTLFYFKSASLATSFVFMLGLVVLLVINEHPRFQKSGEMVRWALTSLCWTSFFGYVVPILFGFIGWIPFVVSILLSATLLYKIGSRFGRIEGIDKKDLRKRMLYPSLGVPTFFFVLYVLKLIPPVPLSIEKMGIYHNITKSNGNYQLYYARPFWKFWESGDQTFAYTPGDRIFCYIRVFSPTTLKEKLLIRWSFYEPLAGWTSYDAIPLEVSGGREQGYRAYAVKSNVTVGRWRVQVETSDGREVGRIHLRVIPAEIGAEPQLSIETD